MEDLTRVVLKVRVEAVSADGSEVLLSFHPSVDGRAVPMLEEHRKGWVRVGHEAKLGVALPSEAP